MATIRKWTPQLKHALAWVSDHQAAKRTPSMAVLAELRRAGHISGYTRYVLTDKGDRALQTICAEKDIDFDAALVAR